MLRTRVITAAVGIPLLMLVVWAGDGWLAAVVAAAAAIAVLELQAARGVLRSLQTALVVPAAASLPLVALADIDWQVWLIAGIVLGGPAVVGFRQPASALGGWPWALAAVVYLGGLASHFVLVRELPDGRDWLLVVLFTVWTTDTGAYFVGRAVGSHKLAPSVSPGKTWEGAGGGQVAGLAAVAVLDVVLDLSLSAGEIVALGVLVPAVGQVGDLAESWLKRRLGVKDSGFLVPGHGGIADRLDSLLFAAPAVFYFVRWFVL
jgi:phosphatidate cytidylyltransferase